MAGVGVAGAVETVEGSEGDMLGAIALHQLLLQFRTNPSFLRLVGSEHIWYLKNAYHLCCQSRVLFRRLLLHC